ncbi:hypothetical protein [Halococcus salifodinae]|uniref:Uncharacterized protein n=1 Tax=Halococcus salifodinae DSM 8989 TaxID=1227456 RepID=M0MPZ8_9EURY|nr:hypothetical protein [Halococcus salifodinae]EMA47792.1 hypothetical protein C450_20776 [Halococcus salifodinae DSM 8989]
MTENVTRRLESDASPADHQPTSEADGETVHAVGDWALVVRADGAVEARTRWDNGDPKTFTTAPTDEAPEPSATYRYGLSIEQVLSRYTHETRFDRDLNERENGAAFRNGIIKALCEFAPATFPGGEGRPAGVIHVNASTGPSTTLVNEDASADGTYATFYPFEIAGESTTEEA